MNEQGLKPLAVPFSEEAERGVIGSILLQPQETIELCSDKLTVGHFFVPALGILFGALLRMYELKKVIDLITVTQFLRDDGQLETVGGPVGVTNLFTFVPTAANANYYIDIVREMYVRRQLIASCAKFAARASELKGEELPSLLDEAQAVVTGLALDQMAESPLKHIRHAVESVLDEFSSAYSHRGRTQGLATGFVDFDRMTSGLQLGEMIVIGARPSMGKTALAMNIAEEIALAGNSVAVFSLETSAHRLARRIICGRSSVSLQKTRDGFFGQEEINRIVAVAGEIKGAPIYIDDTPGLKLYEFKARARRAVTQHKVKLIVIDYLQLMKSESKRAEFNRTLEVTEISAGVKEIGRELNVAVLVLVQLNRQPEGRATGKPRIGDLRESGAIEQDADLIALLHRPEYYASDEEERKDLEGIAELMVVKQKDGPVGDVRLTFLKEFTRFEGAARPLYSNREEERQPI